MWKSTCRGIENLDREKYSGRKLIKMSHSYSYQVRNSGRGIDTESNGTEQRTQK